MLRQTRPTLPMMDADLQRKTVELCNWLVGGRVPRLHPLKVRINGRSVPRFGSDN